MTTKKVATTDSNGFFTIWAKVNNELYIISKEHIDRKIILTQNDFDTNNLIIYLSKKPIELEEVKIVNPSAVKFKVSQNEINGRDLVKLQMDAKRPVVQGVYTGEMVNGVDFIRLGKDIIRLFKKKEEDIKPAQPKIEFKDYVKSNFDDIFFTKTLELQPDAIFRFMEFCDADPSAKTIADGNNKLAVMEFLLAKNKAFKKLD